MRTCCQHRFQLYHAWYVGGVYDLSLWLSVMIKPISEKESTQKPELNYIPFWKATCVIEFFVNLLYFQDCIQTVCFLAHWPAKPISLSNNRCQAICFWMHGAHVDNTYTIPIPTIPSAPTHPYIHSSLPYVIPSHPNPYQTSHPLALYLHIC